MARMVSIGTAHEAFEEAGDLRRLFPNPFVARWRWSGAPIEGLGVL